MTTISDIGERLDLLVRAGADFEAFTVTLLNPDGTPANLTGCAFGGWVRLTYGGDIIATLDFTVLDASAGFYSVFMTADQTELLDLANACNAPGTIFIWQHDLTDSGGMIEPIFYGSLTAMRNLAVP